MTPRVPFNRPRLVGAELDHVRSALADLHLSGNGPYTARCAAWLEDHTSAARVLLTPSCTAALELSALLADIGPGDEVIMPSFTFPSTASAFVLRGGVPVFVDIREDTLNLDETQVESAVTARTRAIVPVHYGGVGCDMDTVMAVAGAHDLAVIEDAAQGVAAYYRRLPLGSIGHLGTFSFHETKIVSCGEGGALLINDPAKVERAEILQEKGTNRMQYFRGQVDRYTWVDAGSSFLLSDLNAAFLFGQLERLDEVRAQRRSHWTRYHEAFADLEADGVVRRPIVPSDCDHSAHLYYLLLPDEKQRDALIRDLAAEDVNAVFHYVPLHSSPAGRRFGRAHGELGLTTSLSARLVRLPLWNGMDERAVDHTIAAVRRAVGRSDVVLGRAEAP